eukprot:TRINITY_DN6033_c0_g1_i1.p1 TRINITY_DN6033_c0_g1~~TRINITY_DN6033_c0_g1_i1.p1  ORF type:complete len:192 (-),score=22.99 TRINITY_DN6033_c0_g1_i1:311-835(-)
MYSKLKGLMATRPILTNCFIYGTFYSGAEFSQQTLLRKVMAKEKSSYDFPLIARYAVLGSTVFPVSLYYWFRFLDKKLVGTAMKIVIPKVIIDQLVSSPYMLITFFVGMSIMEGKKDIFAECKEKMVPSYQKSCMFWLPAQAINFAIIPSSFRVAWVATCSLAWINILCLIKRE